MPETTRRAPEVFRYWWPDGEAGAQALLVLEVSDDTGDSVRVKAYRIGTWDGETNLPVGAEADENLLFAGYIKWDGCSHMDFGADGDDGYLHLCGKPCFDVLEAMLHLAWEKARARHPNPYMRKEFPED